MLSTIPSCLIAKGPALHRVIEISIKDLTRSLPAIKLHQFGFVMLKIKDIFGWVYPKSLSTILLLHPSNSIILFLLVQNLCQRVWLLLWITIEEHWSIFKIKSSTSKHVLVLLLLIAAVEGLARSGTVSSTSSGMQIWCIIKNWIFEFARTALNAASSRLCIWAHVARAVWLARSFLSFD